MAVAVVLGALAGSQKTSVARRPGCAISAGTRPYSWALQRNSIERSISSVRPPDWKRK